MTKPHIDIVLATLPRLECSSPLIGPASLKASLASYGFNSILMDLNIDLRHNVPHELHTLWKDEDITFRFDREFEVFWNSWIKNDLMQDWVDQITHYNPDWLGITLFSQRTKRFAIRFLECFRTIAPWIKIVVGGPYTQYMGHDLVTDGLADHCIIGEAEDALPKLLKGETQPVGVHQIQDLDNLPWPDYSDSKWESYYKFPGPGMGCSNLYIMGSRGCVRNCSFCDVRAIWPKYRYRSGESIAHEMKHQSNLYNIHRFRFVDSLVNGSIGTLTDKCENIIHLVERQAMLPVSWLGHFIVRPPHQLPSELFDMLARSGCTNLAIGIESGSQTVRTHMNKAFTNEDAFYVFDQCRRVGIKFSVLYVVGYPTETEQDFRETLEFTRNLVPYRDSIYQMVLGPTMEILKGAPISLTPLLEDDEGYWYHLDNTKDVRVSRWFRLRRLCENLHLPVYANAFNTKISSRLDIP